MQEQSMVRLLQITLLALMPLLVWETVSHADQTPLLIEALDDANVRRGASIALTKLGLAAVPALRKALTSGTPDARVWSAYTLGEIGPAAEPAVGDLSTALVNSDDALRAAAAQALGKIGTAAAIDALANSLGDKNDRVRQRAAVALGQIGRPSQTATAKLIAVLSDHRVRLFARDALIQMGPSTADLLVESLGDDNIRFEVSAILQAVDPAKAKQAGLGVPTAADLPSLKMVLYDETRQPEERSTAAQSLATLGSEGIAVLTVAFEQQQIARTAVAAFAKAGPEAVPALVGMLSHTSPAVRGKAADAIGHIGAAASAATPALIGLLKDEDRDVRYCAVRALHEFGPKAKPAIPALAEVMLDARELEATRQWSIKTLIVTLPHTHEEVVKALVAASREEVNYGTRQLARQKLKAIDPAAAKAADIK
jgi:HEAT repeat protein